MVGIECKLCGELLAYYGTEAELIWLNKSPKDFRICYKCLKELAYQLYLLKYDIKK